MVSLESAGFGLFREVWIDRIGGRSVEVEAKEDRALKRDLWFSEMRSSMVSAWIAMIFVSLESWRA